VEAPVVAAENNSSVSNSARTTPQQTKSDLSESPPSIVACSTSPARADADDDEATEVASSSSANPSAAEAAATGQSGSSSASGLKVGDKCHGFWGDNWYPGSIRSINEDECEVSWDDGTVSQLPLQFVEKDDDDLVQTEVPEVADLTTEDVPATAQASHTIVDAGTSSTYVVGQRVHAYYPPEWHIAVVRSFPGEKIEVTFDDGSVSELPRLWIEPMDLFEEALETHAPNTEDVVPVHWPALAAIEQRAPKPSQARPPSPTPCDYQDDWDLDTSCVEVVGETPSNQSTLDSIARAAPTKTKQAKVVHIPMAAETSKPKVSKAEKRRAAKQRKDEEFEQMTTMPPSPSDDTSKAVAQPAPAPAPEEEAAQTGANSSGEEQSPAQRRKKKGQQAPLHAKQIAAQAAATANQKALKRKDKARQKKSESQASKAAASAPLDNKKTDTSQDMCQLCESPGKRPALSAEDEPVAAALHVCSKHFNELNIKRAKLHKWANCRTGFVTPLHAMTCPLSREWASSYYRDLKRVVLLVKLLVEEGEDLDAEDDTGFTAVEYACDVVCHLMCRSIKTSEVKEMLTKKVKEVNMITKGDVVEVLETFKSDSDPRKELRFGEVGTVTSIDEDGDALVRFEPPTGNQYVVKENFGKVKLQSSVAPSLLELRVGAKVRAHSLKTESVNGLEGTCESFDQSSGRWKVTFEIGGKRLKPENLEVLSALHQAGEKNIDEQNLQAIKKFKRKRCSNICVCCDKPALEPESSDDEFKKEGKNPDELLEGFTNVMYTFWFFHERRFLGHHRIHDTMFKMMLQMYHTTGQDDRFRELGVFSDWSDDEENEDEVSSAEGESF